MLVKSRFVIYCDLSLTEHVFPHLGFCSLLHDRVWLCQGLSCGRARFGGGEEDARLKVLIMDQFWSQLKSVVLKAESNKSNFKKHKNYQKKVQLFCKIYEIFFFLYFWWYCHMNDATEYSRVLTGQSNKVPFMVELSLVKFSY